MAKGRWLSSQRTTVAPARPPNGQQGSLFRALPEVGDGSAGDAVGVQLPQCRQAHLQGQGAQAVETPGTVLFHHAGAAQADQIAVHLGRWHVQFVGQVAQHDGLAGIGKCSHDTQSDFHGLHSELGLTRIVAGWFFSRHMPSLSALQDLAKTRRR